MRSLKIGMMVAFAVVLAPLAALAQTGPAPKDVLQFRPTLKGVEYEIPPADAIEGCKVEPVVNAQKKPIGWALRDGQGKLLRRFVANRGKKMDQWSYYQDGFEVYRESDLDGNGVLDECRWLNSGGTRIATVSQGKITGWKRISAEEATKVVVQGLVLGDVNLIESVMATAAELEALGVPPIEVDQVKAALPKRLEQVQALQKGLFALGWTGATVWNRLDSPLPHLIPSDPSSDLAKDIVLYENALIFVDTPRSATAATAPKLAFLQAPEIVQIGETWKFLEVPRAIDPEKPVMTAEGGLRAAIFRRAVAPTNDNPALEAALKALAEYDATNGKVLTDRDKKAIAQYHVGRIPKLRAVVKELSTDDEKLPYDKQIVDSFAGAYTTGFYPEGLTFLKKMADGKGKLNSYAAFRTISATFSVKNDEPGANLMANQKDWMNDLKAFLIKYSKSEEEPDALMQLANVNEYNAEEEEARKYYNQLVADFPSTDAGKKAAGSLKRLDLVGKTIDLKGPGLNGEQVSLAKFKGKTVLIAFWASWADPVRRDLPELMKVYNKYHSKDLEIIGIALDNDRKQLDTFLKDNPLPWTQIFEPGGIDSNRFATEYGIIALPTMILVDAQGKVVNRNIRSPAELERQLDKVAEGKQPGVALDR